MCCSPPVPRAQAPAAGVRGPVFECAASGEWYRVCGHGRRAERVLITRPLRALVLSSQDKMLPVSCDMEVRALPAGRGPPRRSDWRKFRAGMPDSG